MPSTLLFSINNEGRVYALSTSNSAWREFLYLGLEFKKISTVPHFMWAIGGDRQVYVHVHGLDVPIRVKEEAYENERWLPIEGFSSRLLPTDRFHFSSMDGTVNREIKNIRLPSMAWQWEGDWHLDCSLDGQPLEHDGWSYAVDFPATYQSKKQWSSYVRRRKWVRFRRYSALNSWCAVAPLHKDATQEPFIDVAIGGINVSSAGPGLLIVWAVTAHGRVMFRTNVSTTSPEGLRWQNIQTPSACEVAQISVGPTGLVWATLYNGRVLVRSGVTRESHSGENWLEVKPPATNLKITQVSVGTNAVWCITNDFHVWFRRGIRGDSAGISEDAAIGTGWVEMVGNISSITVAHNDQVFAIGSEDRALYYRSGICSSDLTGKKWRLIQCPMQLSRTSSDLSLCSTRSGSAGGNGKHKSLNSLFREKYPNENISMIEENMEETSRSAPTANLRHKPELWQKPQESSLPRHKSTDSDDSIDKKHNSIPNMCSSAPIAEIYEVTGKLLKNHRAWSPVRSVGSVVGTEALPETDSSVFEGDSIRDSGVFGGGEDEDHGGSQYWAECDVMWISCSAGAVSIDPNNLPSWFNATFNGNQQLEELTQPWRIGLLENLKKRLPNKESFTNYEKAIEMSSWIKSGEVKAANPGGQFEECLIELEWVNSSSSTGMDSGTLTILNADGVVTKMQVSLSEITCVMCCSEAGSPRLALHAPRLPRGSSPIKLQFSGDTDMEDWMSHLTSVCCQINEVQGRPAPTSIWATTKIGDVFIFDPTNLEYQQFQPDTKNYVQEIDISAAETPYSIPLNNGMPNGSILEITGCVYDDADHIRFDLQCHATVKVRHKAESQRNIPLHVNPRFNEKIIVLNSMECSTWMNEIRDNRMVFAQGAEFKLTITCEKDGFRLAVNDKDYILFKHKISPDNICSLFSSGRVKLLKIIYKNPSVIIPLRDVFWRQMGGHLKRVESSEIDGIIWGIGYDNTAYVYTGGWGGLFLKGMESSSTGINTMIDTHNYYIYENQRWNPISGFSTASLPTDRHMWSDITGKHKRSKDHTKLLSMHWQWVSDWLVDFHTPGGVDREGWQYAIDFPSSYHAKKQFTDYVRRRRWYRKCRLTTSGPWQEVGNTKIMDVSIQVDKSEDNVDNTIIVWAIAANGDVIYRRGVTQSNLVGTSWEHITSEEPLVSISYHNEKLWAIGKNGSAFFRHGVTKIRPQGLSWQPIEPPSGISFRQISVGAVGIWALDGNGTLVVRKEVSNSYPEGTHWHIIKNVQNDPPHYEGNIGFKNVSVGKQVWAISNSCYVCKRTGITKDNVAGTGWILGLAANWQDISVKGL